MAKKIATKRIKSEKYQTEEQAEIMRFVKILIIVLILILGVYLFTRIFVTKDLFNEKKENDTVISGEIDYSKTIIGSMLNKPEDEYYVLIYDKEDIKSVYYGGLITTYARNENALKVYYADLSNELNKKYVTTSDKEVNTTSLENFKVKNLALIKIKDGKITSSSTNEDDIAEELKYVKENAE